MRTSLSAHAYRNNHFAGHDAEHWGAQILGLAYSRGEVNSVATVTIVYFVEIADMLGLLGAAY